MIEGAGLPSGWPHFLKMQLIANKDIYRGKNRGGFIRAGTSFFEPEKTYQREYLFSGSARVCHQSTMQIAHEPPMVAGMVTCICPTRNRLKFLPAAIACFQAQAYENRELLIVDDGEEAAQSLIPDDPRIRYVRLRHRKLIGDKRNFCCEMARGEFIAHWDDDDWYAPSRLSDQIAAFVNPAVQVHGFSSIQFHDLRDGQAWAYDCSYKRYAVGTTLVYRRSWWRLCKFKDFTVGEDNDFVERAGSGLAYEAGNGRVVATIHGSKTSPCNMKGKQWKRTSADKLPEGYRLRICA